MTHTHIYTYIEIIKDAFNIYVIFKRYFKWVKCKYSTIQKVDAKNWLINKF